MLGLLVDQTGDRIESKTFVFSACNQDDRFWLRFQGLDKSIQIRCLRVVDKDYTIDLSDVLAAMREQPVSLLVRILAFSQGTLQGLTRTQRRHKILGVMNSGRRGFLSSSRSARLESESFPPGE